MVKRALVLLLPVIFTGMNLVATNAYTVNFNFDVGVF